MAGKKVETAPKDKVKMTISSVIADLNSGIDRNGIKEKYGLTRADVIRLFQHEQLKGRKVKSAPGFELVDDVTGTDLALKPKTAEAEVAETASTTEKVAEVGETAGAKKGVW